MKTRDIFFEYFSKKRQTYKNPLHFNEQQKRYMILLDLTQKIWYTVIK